MDSNWTELASITNGTSKHYSWYRIAQAGDTTPTVTLTGTGVTGDTQLSQIHGFRPTSGKFPRLDVTGTESTNVSADNVGPITGLTAVAGTLGVLTCGKSNDWNGTATLASWSLSAQSESTTGNDAGNALLYVLSMASGATGNLTVTDSGGTASAGVGAGMINTFKEIFELATGVAEETDTAIAPTVGVVVVPGFSLPLMFYWGSKEPTVVATGTANETDSSFALTRTKFYATAVSSETDTALAVTRSKVKAAGVADEVDSSLHLTRTKIKSYLESNETDTSLALTAAELRAIGVALETDTAEQLSKLKLRSTGVSLETDTAEALTRIEVLSVGIAAETDTSLNLERVKLYDVTLSSESDLAVAPSVQNVGANPPAFYFPLRFNIGAIFVQPPVQYAVETDTALALVRTKFYSVQLASETDVALNLGTGEPGFWLPLRFYVGVPGGAKLVNTGRAESTNTALANTLVRSPQKTMVRWAQETAIVSAVTYRKVRATGVAVSVNTSVTQAVARTRVTGVSIETDTAFGPPLGIVGQVGVATEVDTAFHLNRIQAVTVKIANETDNALALIAPTAVDVGVAIEVDEALLLETSFARGVSAAIELDEALPLDVLHTLAVKIAESTNTAINLSRIRVTDTHFAQSFNTAFNPTKIKIRPTQTAVEVDAARGMLVRSYAAREYDNALFMEIKQDGVVIFPVVISGGDKRMWTGFIT